MYSAVRTTLVPPTPSHPHPTPNYAKPLYYMQSLIRVAFTFVPSLNSPLHDVVTVLPGVLLVSVNYLLKPSMNVREPATDRHLSRKVSTRPMFGSSYPK